MKINVAHESVPAVGQVENGDRAFQRRAHGVHLLSVIDGLGHGSGAMEASHRGAEFLEGVDLRRPLLDIMEGMHTAMGGTRGAAATVCLFRDDNSVEACAVGNVEFRSASLRIPLVASPGVLGVRVARFRTCEASVHRPVRIVLFSDGISSRVRFEEFAHLAPKECCQQLMTQHRKDHDDSTVLVADVEPNS